MKKSTMKDTPNTVIVFFPIVKLQGPQHNPSLFNKICYFQLLSLYFKSELNSAMLKETD